MTGKFITLEGGEGAGKSTVLTAVRDALVAHGVDVVVTREPGGTDLGEALRGLLLDPRYRGLCAESELLMMFAARAQLVREVIMPALARGAWVLSDRFTDASYAYQGGGRGQPQERIEQLEGWAAAGLIPDLTLLLDLPVAQGLQRAATRAENDRIEMESAVFFEKVRATYLARAQAHRERYRVIDASLPLPDVLRDVQCAVEGYIGTTGT